MMVSSCVWTKYDEHQLIPVPRTESSRWQALSTLLGVRVVGEASVSHLERGSPLSVVFRVSPTSIPNKVCLSYSQEDQEDRKWWGQAQV